MTRDQLIDDIARVLALHNAPAQFTPSEADVVRARLGAELILKKVLKWVASSDTEAFGTPNAAPSADPSK